MFGGLGLFRDGLMIAIVQGGRLYLKVDDQTRPAFEAAQGQPFEYRARQRTVALTYWTPPDSVFEDPDEVCVWAERAYEAARRGAIERPASRRSKRVQATAV